MDDEDGQTTNYPIYSFSVVSAAEADGECDADKMTASWNDGDIWTGSAGTTQKNMNEGAVVGVLATGVPTSRTYHIAFRASCNSATVYKVHAQSQATPAQSAGPKDFNYTVVAAGSGSPSDT